MTSLDRLINAVVGLFVRALCRVDDEQIASIPMQGPLILVANHVNFLEIPVLHSRLLPREVVGLAKAESWDNRLLGWLFDRWGAIPIRRGEADIVALRRALAVLDEGGILAVAPEGTRSRHGRLQRGHPGVVTLAAKSGAPVLPVVFYGGEQLGVNLRRLRRTRFHILVGKPFCVTTDAARPSREIRQRIADEIMARMAALLPPAYRGAYADVEPAASEYLRPAVLRGAVDRHD